VWRTVVAGVLVPLGVAILSIPSSIFGGSHPNTTAQAVVFVIELAAFALIAVPALINPGTDADAPPNTFVQIFGPVYLAVLGILWLTALPEYLSAKGGVTADATPTGNVFYAGVCLVVAALLVWLTNRSTYGANRLRSSSLSSPRSSG